MTSEIGECRTCPLVFIGADGFDAAFDHTKATGHDTHVCGVPT